MIGWVGIIHICIIACVMLLFMSVGLFSIDVVIRLKQLQPREDEKLEGEKEDERNAGC